MASAIEISSTFPSSFALLCLVNLLLLAIAQSCLLLSAKSLPFPLHLVPISCFLLVAAMLWRRLLLNPASQAIYLVDFSCLKPPSSLRVPVSALLEHLSLINCFDKESVAFMAKIISASGLGEETYFPPSLRYIPPKTNFSESISEAHLLLFPVLDDLFSKTGVNPAQIDVLVVNCSGFCPAPSLTAMVVNHYGMREDIRSFNLSGMGCSAGVIALDVARGILTTCPRECSYAVVLSTEILSTGWYNGTDRRKLLLNCVFRMGSAAALLSNRNDYSRGGAKYRLVRLLRTQRAFDDASYRSATREEDEQGITGFSIERDLLRVARETLRSNVVAVGASILPLHEKIRYVLFQLRRAAASWGCGGKAEEQPYVPDFSSVIQQYSIPSSGMAVIREIGKGLGLREWDLEPAMSTFHRFGNQSSSSMWYQMAYMEAKERVKKGDRVWQLGMGSGPKSNTAVWECLLKDMAGEVIKGPWRECIDRYPLHQNDHDQHHHGHHRQKLH